MATQIETWNGTATIISASHSGYLSPNFANKLMDGEFRIEECDGRDVVFGKGTDGMRARLAWITFPDDETRNNYLADFAS